VPLSPDVARGITIPQRSSGKPTTSSIEPTQVGGTREFAASPAAEAFPRLVDPIRVVVVSEFLLIRAGLVHLLEAAGLAIVGQSTTGEEALAMVESVRPDIILLDLDSGPQALACIDDLVLGAPNSRVVLLCERVGCADQSRLIELGASGLVPKTAPPAILVKAVRKVHAGEVWLDRRETAKAFNHLTRRRRAMEAEVKKIAVLTKREHEIIALIGQGLKNAAIGERLFISESTVRNHLTSILDKLDVTDRFELVVYAFKHGLVRFSDLEIDPKVPPPPTKNR
jgi:DNA-binding NarL/FixJ family response regulator